MRVRALDANGDWQFGKGQNDYKKDRAAVAQCLQTRIQSFLGNCFFDAGAGIDWFNYLGGKDSIGLQLAISAVIINTQGVTGIVSLNLDVTPDRNFIVQYVVNSIYGVVESEAEIEALTPDFLTTEDDDPLITEDGENIIV